MTDEPNLKLYPHQLRLLEVWRNEAPCKLAVAWPAGAGAIGTLSELVKELPKAQRVLIITDRVEFAQQFLQRLIEEGITSCFVDRAQFLQLQSRTDADTPEWTAHQAFALTAALATRSDVAASLKIQHWDLLVFLDTTYAATHRWVESLHGSHTRIIWKLRPGYDVSALQRSEWYIDQMSMRDVLESRGMPGKSNLHLTIRLSALEPSEGELVVWGLIAELVQATKGSSAEHTAATLQARWSSSPASLENGLRRVEHALTWQWPLWDEATEDGDELVAEASSTTDIRSKAKALALIKECLVALDELGPDRKLQALIDLLRQHKTSRSTCVFVRYRDTATYVHSALEDQSLPCVLVHGGMPPIDIKERLHRALQEPGQVLVMTTAMLSTGLDLRQVRDLVLYDSPATVEVMSQTLARFYLHAQQPLQITVVGDQHSVRRAADLVEQASQFTM